MFNRLKALKTIDKSILLVYMIDCTLDEPRPKAISFNSLYNGIDYINYSQEEYNIAFSKLIKSGIFQKLKSDSYIMNRLIFLHLLDDIKWYLWFRKIIKKIRIIWSYIWKNMLVTIITSTIVAIITSLITIYLKESN